MKFEKTVVYEPEDSRNKSEKVFINITDVVRDGTVVALYQGYELVVFINLEPGARLTILPNKP